MIEYTTIYARELFDKYYQLAESIDWTDKETKEKAEKFNDDLGADVDLYWHALAKQSALIAVDEIINELKSIRITLSPGSYVSYKDYQRDLDGIQQDAIAKLLFLGEVKRQLEQL
jgi:hypothetical protein